MEAAFAALDLQETRNYSKVAKEYELKWTTLTKRYKGQRVSKKVFLYTNKYILVGLYDWETQPFGQVDIQLGQEGLYN
jgi:hypothetical protein